MSTITPTTQTATIKIIKYVCFDSDVLWFCHLDSESSISKSKASVFRMNISSSLHIHTQQCRIQDFPDGDTNPWVWSKKLLFGKVRFFMTIAWKWKKLDLERTTPLKTPTPTPTPRSANAQLERTQDKEQSLSLWWPSRLAHSWHDFFRTSYQSDLDKKCSSHRRIKWES